MRRTQVRSRNALARWPLSLVVAIATALPILAQDSAPTPPRIVVDELGRLPTFSHATILGDVVFVSGTLGTEAGSLGLVPGGVGPQTTQTLRNIERILEAAGSSLAHVAKCNVYLADMSQFDAMNRAYLAVFPENPPARTTTNSPDLALGALVEIECAAALATLRKANVHLERPVQQTTGILEHDGEEIYYEVTGEGAPVVLSHGAGGNHAIWYQQVLELAQRYKVITWDQRSFGRTTNRADAAGPEAFASDLEALLDHLGIPSAHLVGQSMGGWTTMTFALANPDRVRSIVLADTPGGIVTPQVREDIGRLMSPGGSAAPETVWQHPAVGSSTTEQDPTVGFLYRQIGSLAPAADITKIAQRMFGMDHTQAAAQLDVPFLLIVGSEDQLFTPKAIRSVANRLGNVRVAEIPGAGHSPYFEAPARWNEIVLEFLAEQE